MNTNNERYGLLGTTLWFLAVMAVFTLVQTFVLGFFVATTQPTVEETPSPEEMEAMMMSLQFNGNFVSLSTIISGLVCILLIFLAIKLKKGLTISEYVGFIKRPFPEYLKWGAVFIAFLLTSEALTYLLGKDSMPDVMIEIYNSASQKWALWLAIILVAPLFEEIFFRGFLFKGLESTFFGTVGTILITSLIWAAIHLQYEAYYIGIIFLMGLLLGYIRHKTGSVYIPIFLHVLSNFLSTVQVHYLA